MTQLLILLAVYPFAVFLGFTLPVVPRFMRGLARLRLLSNWIN